MESKQLVFHQNVELFTDKTNIRNNTRDHQLSKKGQKKAINIKISLTNPYFICLKDISESSL